ncbi:M48 family metalloprotease [Nocardia sp. SYP-A9097]|uniref:M48 family metalloprotease n=1 Tax=Nocardia sp. SYP-A9097 TaxID=2663237 RepID=UPI00129A228A|nr:M48 family metalloprotease [Nocardia sp. SYP-A9097]MRH88030.1 M48 family metalloprotease [Nocardia sp. SYP-A9097]
MSTDAPDIPAYRFTGRARIEAKLLPLARLLIAVPWAVATVVLLRSLALWVGLWAVLVLVVIRCLAWICARIVNWINPDEETWRRNAREWPDKVRYPPGRDDPYALLVEARKDVMLAAGLPESWLRLLLKKSPHKSASAGPHRLVAVSISAVNQLPPPQLRALVAHELGHELIGGAIVRNIEALCTTPVSAIFDLPAINVLYLLADKDRWSVLRVVLLLITAPVLFAAFVALMLPAIAIHPALVLATLCFLQPFPRAWLSWRGEYLADQVATDLGYGPALRDYLIGSSVEYGGGFTRTHPSAHARIRRSERREHLVGPGGQLP